MLVSGMQRELEAPAPAKKFRRPAATRKVSCRQKNSAAPATSEAQHKRQRNSAAPATSEAQHKRQRSTPTGEPRPRQRVLGDFFEDRDAVGSAATRAPTTILMDTFRVISIYPDPASSTAARADRFQVDCTRVYSVEAWNYGPLPSPSPRGDSTPYSRTWQLTSSGRFG